MHKSWKLPIFIIVFIAAFGLVFITGYFREIGSVESGSFKIELCSGDIKSTINPVIFDIQNKATEKSFIKPGRIKISTGDDSAIINKSKEPILISVNATGFNGNVKVVSDNPKYDNKTSCCRESLICNELLKFRINLDIPQSDINRYVISKGKILFYNAKCSELVGEVPVEIINSLRKPCCDP